MFFRGGDTPRHVPLGTHPANQLGLQMKFSRKKSNRSSRAFQLWLFGHRLECLAGTQAEFVKAAARIHGTGGRWPSWSRFRRTNSDDVRFLLAHQLTKVLLSPFKLLNVLIVKLASA
jgi:hypothetical protein